MFSRFVRLLHEVGNGDWYRLLYNYLICSSGFHLSRTDVWQFNVLRFVIKIAVENSTCCKITTI